MTKKYLSILILSGLLICLVVPLAVNAACTLEACTSSVTSIAAIIKNIFQPLWQLAAGLAVIMVIAAGIMFLTSAGDPGKVTTARNAVLWAVVGIIVAILAFSIVTIVGGWVSG